MITPRGCRTRWRKSHEHGNRQRQPSRQSRPPVRLTLSQWVVGWFPTAPTNLFNNLWLVTSIPLSDCGCFCGCAKSQVLLLIPAVDHIFDRERESKHTVDG